MYTVIINTSKFKASNNRKKWTTQLENDFLVALNGKKFTFISKFCNGKHNEALADLMAWLNYFTGGKIKGLQGSNPPL